MRHVLLLTLAMLVLAAPAAANPNAKRATHLGTLVARTPTSVTVKRVERAVTCSRGDASPKLAGARVGDKVKFACNKGVLVAFNAVLSGSATGAIVSLSDASIALHTDAGDVTCARRDGSPRLGDFRVGDMVKITCADGVLTAVAKLDIPADVQTGFGTLTALSAFSLTVHSETRDLTCTLSDRSPGLGEFHVGDRVKVSCTNGVLTSIAKANVTSMTTGLLTALLPTSLTVLSDGGERACSRNGGSPSLEGYHVGDRVKMTCVNGVLTAIAKIDAPAEVKTGLGTLTALTDASLTVHTDGGDLTCRRGDGSPSLGDYHVGDRVKLSCTNGVLTTIAKVDTVTTMITSGVLTALSPTSLTVLSDGGEKTCSRTGGSPSLDGYLVGQHVKATCVNGVLTAIEHL